MFWGIRIQAGFLELKIGAVRIISLTYFLYSVNLNQQKPIELLL